MGSILTADDDVPESADDGIQIFHVKAEGRTGVGTDIDGGIGISRLQHKHIVARSFEGGIDFECPRRKGDVVSLHRGANKDGIRFEMQAASRIRPP